MKILTIAAFGMAIAAGPLLAESHATGDADAGKKVFKKCKSCHSIVSTDGDEISKGGKVGPNLYGIYDRTAGTEEGFKYGNSIVEAGEKGLKWNEADFVTYVADAKRFLADYLEQGSAKSKMAFKLKDEDDAKDLWAYLVSVGPEM